MPASAMIDQVLEVISAIRNSKQWFTFRFDYAGVANQSRRAFRCVVYSRTLFDTMWQSQSQVIGQEMEDAS